MIVEGHLCRLICLHPMAAIPAYLGTAPVDCIIMVLNIEVHLEATPLGLQHCLLHRHLSVVKIVEVIYLQNDLPEHPVII